ncbi:hypothetical protein G6F23_015712 [Rhizopus arrhizus]|nr:hypothetical protein G6F23_015712 [Rhizopus arrhizus]
MAPAEGPPMLLNRYSRASASTALGYTMPLVMPPFMTRSQYLSATNHLPSAGVQYGKRRSHSLRSGPQHCTVLGP